MGVPTMLLLAALAVPGPRASDVRELLDALVRGDAQTAEVLPALHEARGETIDALAELAAADPTTAARRIAVDLLGRLGGSEETELLTTLVRVPGASATPRELATAFERALLLLLAREPATLAATSRLVGEVPLDLVDAVVRDAGALGTTAALQALCDALGVRREADARLLSEIRRLGSVPPKPLGIDLARVRGCLDAQDPLVRVLAIQCAGSLEDVGSIPRLIDLLEDAGAPAAHAARALRELTSQDLKANARAWRAWHAEEERWWYEESGDVLARTLAPEPDVAAAALQAAGEHRLYRHELARALVPALDRPETELVRLACSKLASLGSRTVLADLIRLLNARDAGVRAAAHGALVAVTGRNLPPDPEAWRAEELPR